MNNQSPTTQTTTLHNGLRVITDQIASVASISVGVWVGTGARSEEAAINGAAHYLEHMAFKGTTTRSAHDIAMEVEAVGGNFNAYTARENTAYFVKVLKDDLPLAVDILADILRNPTFEPDELERERGVITQEIGQSMDTPDDIIYDYFQETAYPNQPMGRPILGSTQTVRDMKRDSLMDFMKQRYTAQNMILVATGAVDHAQIVKMAEEKFGYLDKAEAQNLTPSSYQGGVHLENRDSEQVHFKLGFEGVQYGAESQFAAALLGNLLGGGMSSRLFQEIREKRGLVYSIYAYSQSFTDSGLFGLYAGTGQDEIQELIPVLSDCLNDSRKNISSEELNRSKTQLKASILMSMESTDSRADQLGSQMLIYNRFWTMDELSRKIDAVTLEEVSSVAEQIFSSTPTMAAIGPLDKLESYDLLRARF